MRILVTNDDGIDAVGLHVLARRLGELGDVVVAAPDREYSGAAAALGALHLIQPEVRRVSGDIEKRALLPDLVRGRASSHEPRHTLDDLGAAGEGFRLLHDEPGRGFAFGAIGRFWQASIELAEVTAERFSAFDEPGYGKVAWGLRFEPLGDAATRIVLELYMGATDERAWQAARA